MLERPWHLDDVRQVEVVRGLGGRGGVREDRGGGGGGAREEEGARGLGRARGLWVVDGWGGGRDELAIRVDEVPDRGEVVAHVEKDQELNVDAGALRHAAQLVPGPPPVVL